MPDKTPPPDLVAGQNIAMQLVPMVNWAEGQVDDGVHFWAGLMAGLAGCMAESIGPAAAETIGQSVAHIAKAFGPSPSHHAH
jgi:hypothetical protein